MKHIRLLVTLCFALKINQTPSFHFFHLNYMIPTFMWWRNITQQDQMHNVSGLPFSHFLACHSQENAYTQHLHAVYHNTMASPQSACHVLSLIYGLWMHIRSKCVGIHFVSFTSAASHNCVGCESCLHQHGSTNALMAALDVSLLVRKPMLC